MRYLLRTCAVCESSEAENVFTQNISSISGLGDIGYKHQINICQKCGFTFASPLLPEKEILRYYENLSNYEQHHTGGEPSKESREMSARQIEFIKQYFDTSYRGSAIDIGCSIAYTLSLLKSDGWDVIGIDPSDWCVGKSKELFGVHVKKGFLDQDTKRHLGKKDVVIFSHVLEHLIDPGHALRLSGEILKDDGLIYVEVPNFKEHNNLTGYFTFEHINFFSTVSITNIAQANGFRVCEMKLFDNQQFSGSYPVIAAILKRSTEPLRLSNDYLSAEQTIEEYANSRSACFHELNNRIMAAASEIEPGKLAVWGAGIHTSQLLDDTVLCEVPIACIFDNDPKKAGLFLNSIPVINPPKNLSNFDDGIKGILISSQASEGEIYENLKVLEDRGIKIFRLYS